jgi:hypothetical protein
MRLVHNPEAVKPWGYFGNNKDKKWTDFDKVREEIVR